MGNKVDMSALYSAKRFDQAIAVRVTASLNGNNSPLADVERVLEAYGLDGMKTKPRVQTDKSVFTASISKSSGEKYNVGGKVHHMTFSALKNESGDMVTRACNVAIEEDSKRNELIQVGRIVYDPDTEYVSQEDYPHPDLHLQDYENLAHAANRAQLSVSKYGNRVTTKFLRSYLTELCVECGGIQFLGNRGDWVIIRQPDLGEDDPGKIMLRAKDAIEALDGYNLVSVMSILDEEDAKKHLAASAQMSVTDELRKIRNTAFATTRDGSLNQRSITKRVKSLQDLTARLELLAPVLSDELNATKEAIRQATEAIKKQRTETHEQMLADLEDVFSEEVQ